MLTNDFNKILEKEIDDFNKIIRLLKKNLSTAKNVDRLYRRMITNLKKRIKDLEETIAEKKDEKRQLKDSFDELLYMQKLSKTIRFSKNVPEVLKILIDITKQVLPVQESDVFLFDKEKNDYKSLTLKNKDSRLYRAVKNYVEEGIIKWVIEEKRAIVVSDIETLSNKLPDGSERNYVFVPLYILGEDLGIYVIYTKQPKNKFTKQDLEMLALLTEQAAIAIENIRVNRKLRNSEKIAKKYKSKLNSLSKGQTKVQSKPLNKKLK